MNVKHRRRRKVSRDMRLAPAAGPAMLVVAMLDADEQNKLLALLAWWREGGVADAFDAVPVDWTARRDAAPGADFAWPRRDIDPAPGRPRPAGRMPPGRSPETSRPLTEPSLRPQPPVARPPLAAAGGQ